MTWTDRDSPHEIKEFLPAPVLVRRSALFQVGLMDES